MSRPRVFAILLVTALDLGGCSLVVDFDRSLLVDAGTDGGAIDGSVDAESQSDAGVEAGALGAD